MRDELGGRRLSSNNHSTTEIDELLNAVSSAQYFQIDGRAVMLVICTQSQSDRKKHSW